MVIDRSNYQIWFLDLIDGSLNEQEKIEVEKFLACNPDLRDELESLKSLKLNPGADSFPGKESSIKSVSDYSPFQFEYLCVASLENDLKEGQISELQEMIATDNQKKSTFELYRRLKLKPLPGIFTKKHIIRRLTAGQKILRISLAGSAIAASLAVLTIAYLFFTGRYNENPVRTSTNISPDTLVIKSGMVIFSPDKSLLTENAPNVETKGETGRIQASRRNKLLAVIPDLSPVTDNIERLDSLVPLEVIIPDGTIAVYVPSSTGLIARKTESLPPIFDDGRSNVARFLARFFHETIMNDKIAGDKPVESIEIAEAGITGINKLLGWDMELQKKTDENGSVTSYYFSSRLLKFNAPVKKQEKEL